MDQYKTTEEKSTQWGVTPKTLQNLCRQGKIEGAVKRAGTWFIPDYAPSPLKNTKADAGVLNFVGTKRAIFDNAIMLFMKNGYENVTVRDIAESAGIRQSALYNHFSSKQNILDTIYEFFIHYFLADRPDIESLNDVIQNGSLLDIIKSVRYDFEAGYIEQTLIEISILAFQRQGIDEQARYLIKTLMIDDGIAYVEAVLNKAVAMGRIAPLDTRVISVLIISVRLYTLNIAILDSSPDSLETIYRDENSAYQLAASLLTDLRDSK